MASLKISYLLDKLMLNNQFSTNLENAINNIIKDGKLDHCDLPEIILIISELITNTPSITLTAENLSDLINELITFIVKKYNLTSADTQNENFKRLINSSVKLLLFNPKIKEKLGPCCSKFNVICK